MRELNTHDLAIVSGGQGNEPTTEDVIKVVKAVVKVVSEVIDFVTPKGPTA